MPLRTNEIMKNTMLTMLLGLALGAMTLNATAQENPAQDSGGSHWGNGGGSLTNRINHIAEQLQLSATQKEQFTAAMETEAQQARALRQNQSLTQQQRREQMGALHKELVSQLKTIFTPEQFTEWQSLERSRHGGRQQGSSSTPQ